MKQFRVIFEDGGQVMVEAENSIKGREYVGMAFPKRAIKRVVFHTKKESA